MQKKHFKHTNARYNTEDQLDNRNLRTWQLRDLLHVAGERPFIKQPIMLPLISYHTSFIHTFVHASQCIDGPVITGVIEPINPTLIYRKQRPVHLNIDTWEGIFLCIS